MKKSLQLLKVAAGPRIPFDACVHVSEYKTGLPAVLDYRAEYLQMDESFGRRLVNMVATAIMKYCSGSKIDGAWALKRATAKTLIFRL